MFFLGFELRLLSIPFPIKFNDCPTLLTNFPFVLTTLPQDLTNDSQEMTTVPRRLTRFPLKFKGIINEPLYHVVKLDEKSVNSSEVSLLRFDAHFFVGSCLHCLLALLNDLVQLPLERTLCSLLKSLKLFCWYKFCHEVSHV